MIETESLNFKALITKESPEFYCEINVEITEIVVNKWNEYVGVRPHGGRVDFAEFLEIPWESVEWELEYWGSNDDDDPTPTQPPPEVFEQWVREFVQCHETEVEAFEAYLNR